jgi:hypothetical protein
MAQVSALLPLVGEAGARWKMPWQGPRQSWSCPGRGYRSSLSILFFDLIIRLFWVGMPAARITAVAVS